MLEKLWADKSALHPILVLFSLVLVFSLMALGLLMLLGKMNGVNYLEPVDNPSLHYLEIQLIVQHFFMFIIPGALTIYNFPALRQKGAFALSFIGWDKLGLIVLLFVLGLPLVGLLTWLNMKIPLSGNLEAMESQVNGFLRTLLSTGNMGLVVFLIGLVPAVGEELIFRGVIQKTLENWTRKPHFSILVAGLIFSLIHMQFAGFLPRMFLGMLLGYAYYFSGSLIVPMVLHFVFNASQAVAMVLNPEMIDELGDSTSVDLPAWWVILLAGIGFVLIFIRLIALDNTDNNFA
ncbi:MAG TPA: CPBP family intramembrane metalloprotease [Saprospiraceae bacterium]|nr:CPBP family intramembrane metalloprotease [Saprospiraceae bacterium]